MAAQFDTFTETRNHNTGILSLDLFFFFFLKKQSSRLGPVMRAWLWMQLLDQASYATQEAQQDLILPKNNFAILC